MGQFKTIEEKLQSRKILPLWFNDKLWDSSLDKKISSLTVDPALKAGFFIWNDNFDTAHKIVQDIHTANGSLWHAILHRREGNFWNSKYWYQQVGEHPIFETVRDAIKNWDPISFVDNCEESIAKKDSKRIKELEVIQMVEFESFYHYLCDLEGL